MGYSSRSDTRGRRQTFGGTSRPQFGRGRRTNNKSKYGGKAYIHPSRFIKAPSPVTAETEVYEPTHLFPDFGMHDLLLANIEAKGFITPSPIQDQTIPLGLEGSDVIGVANTGTGKTVAFAVPTLHRLMDDKSARALIIAPTRELAQQIEEECRSIGKGSGLRGALLIGGTPMGPQLRDLRDDPRIVIGTPGRIKDHTERGSLNLSQFKIIVLDEVDRMLDMGFLPDVTDILSQVSKDRQSFFFSATLDSKVRSLIDQFAIEPVTVSVKTGETAENVHQDVVAYQTVADKIVQLHDILLKDTTTKAIIFDDTQRSVERLSNELNERGFKTDAIHGGKSQGQRQRALKRFKDNQITILVATDVAARGIDVSDISHVINFSTPQSYEDYIHRIGRAGRAGRIGYAYTFVEAR